MGEAGIGFSNGEGDSIARDILDEGFGRVMGPSEVTSKREEVLESERKGVFEIGKNRVKERRG
ncbi:FAD-binding dehydrogenase [Sesbania bispinosa]|nr:FAD-binding dehydrogenase [Sesbania bispinosa]